MSPVEVIGAGFGRTGTMSLYTALNQLGFKTYHMVEAIKNSHLPYWARLGRGETTDFTPVLANYNATTDFPACMYYDTLLEQNPKAKVVLTVRDPDAWYNSAIQTILAVDKAHHDMWLLPYIPPFSYMGGRTIADACYNLAFGKNAQFSDREACIRAYQAHIEEVKRRVPADQLLVYNVKEGWEPLCKFLGVPVPTTPFPNVNDVAEFQQRIKVMAIIDKALVLLLTGGVAYAAYAAAQYFNFA